MKKEKLYCMKIRAFIKCSAKALVSVCKNIFYFFIGCIIALAPAYAGYQMIGHLGILIGLIVSFLFTMFLWALDDEIRNYKSYMDDY